jgi:MoaA/NifB/PqqE/SkfB family radical SAM enzyme
MEWENVVNNFQVDLSSHCNARCGGCVRNADGNTTRPEVTLSHFDADVWQRLVTQDTRGWYIVELTLNGNWGDPMMHPQVIEMLELYSQYHPESELFIHTNGSLRTTKFWSELASVCKKFSNHQIFFAVDGMADAHHIYRRKTDWHKLIENSIAFNQAGGRSCYTMTLFEHNKHQVKQVEALAEQNGCVFFQLRHSHGDDLYVETENGSYRVYANYETDRYEQSFDAKVEINGLRDSDTYHDFNNTLREQTLNTKCPWYNERKIQLDPWTRVWPCCHISSYGLDIPEMEADVMVDSKIELARTENDLKRYTLHDILKNEWFSDVEDAVYNAEWKECKNTCKVCK